jgi:LCP family protein required for cell wall assembly
MSEDNLFSGMCRRRRNLIKWSLTLCGTSLLGFVLGACALVMHVGMLESSPTIESISTTRLSLSLERTSKPPSTPTPMPTMTAVPSPTSTPTSIYPWEGFPAPVEESEMEIPRPVQAIDLPQETINIVLLGSDRRSSWKYYQTDALMILSLDLEENTATLISIPRDLYVYIPGWKVNRINTAEPRGGFEMIADTVLYNLGIPLHHWVRVEYREFEEVIDILGGLDVHSTGRVKDMCEGIEYEYKPDVIYHLDGFTAMCYIRMRMKSSDFDRLRRQHEVVQALFDKFISINGIIKVPQLYDQFRNVVEMDMTLDDILPLIPLATKLALDPSQIRFFRMDYTMVENWRTPESGQAVLLPKRELIRDMFEEAFGDSQDPSSSRP